MAAGQAKLTFAVSKVFSACNEPWNYCMPSKMAADEKPKEHVPQAGRAGKQNLKHKVSFLIWIVVKFSTKIRECMSSCPKAGQAVTRQRMSSWSLLGRRRRRSGEARWVQRWGRRSEMMMLRWDAAAKMDWPRLGLIKSQGWCCRSADTVIDYGRTVWLTWTRLIQESHFLNCKNIVGQSLLALGFIFFSVDRNSSGHSPQSNFPLELFYTKQLKGDILKQYFTPKN